MPKLAKAGKKLGRTSSPEEMYTKTSDGKTSVRLNAGPAVAENQHEAHSLIYQKK
jgi:hypothetical protein